MDSLPASPGPFQQCSDGGREGDLFLLHLVEMQGSQGKYGCLGTGKKSRQDEKDSQQDQLKDKIVFHNGFNKLSLTGSIPDCHVAESPPSRMEGKRGR